MKQLTIEDITWEIVVTPDDTRVRGNAIDSGDEAFDKQVEDEINERLENGDAWAWALVEVRGTFEGLEASDYLGGCSYKDEADFKACGYYTDMQDRVLAELQEKAETIAQAMEVA